MVASGPVVNMQNMVKYEVWGRKEVGRKRQRLAYGFESEASARKELEELRTEGRIDLIIAQRSPTYGRISGIQAQGRSE